MRGIWQTYRSELQEKKLHFRIESSDNGAAMTASYLPLWEKLRSEQFDPLALWQRVGEDMQLLREVVNIFSAEYPAMLLGIEQALKQQDAAKLQKAGHKLKGSLLQLSAFAAAAPVAQMEEQAANLSLERAHELLAEAIGEIDSLLRSLNAMISSAQASGHIQARQR